MKNKIIFNNKYLNDDSVLNYCIDYIKSVNFSEIKDGKINITNEIWANVQTYMTKSDALFEAHRQYIDIQYMISGKEYIFVSDYKKCSPEIVYNEQNDIEFLQSNDYTNVTMHSGDFLILYPSDAHKPSISINESTQVRKMVIKVPVHRNVIL